MSEDERLGIHIARGSIWAMVSRWSMRLLGLVNTIVLARLLTPADFGVVTIAMIIAGAIEIFGQTGQWLAIIRHPAPTREHYDSAWSVSIVLNLVLGILIWLAAPVAVLYFHESRASVVVHVVAFRTMISGLENVGVVNFQRAFNFRRLSVYNSFPSVVSFVLTLASAVFLRNYWALVIGIMSQQVATIVLSYAMESFRPRIGFSKVREIWSFSIWTMIRGVGAYVNNQVDKVAIGGFSNAATMGRYEIASDVATTPTSEINAPMIGAMFPVMAKVQHDHVRRRALYLQVLYWSALICTSTAVGVALVSNDMVDLVLGSQWNDAKPLFPWLALAFGILGLSSSVSSAFEVVGLPGISARLQWARFAALLLAIAVVALLWPSARGIAIARLAVTVAVTPPMFIILARTLELSGREIVDALWRPLAASLAMTLVVLGTNAILAFSGSLRLAGDVVLGAATYVAAILTTWHLLGRPEGPETIVLGAIRSMMYRAEAVTRLFSGRASID